MTKKSVEVGSNEARALELNALANEMWDVLVKRNVAIGEAQLIINALQGALNNLTLGSEAPKEEPKEEPKEDNKENA